MDKQTAVDLLDNLLGMVEDNHGSDYDKAIHMGIDALKTQDMSGNMSGTQKELKCTETHSCDYQRTETHEWIPVSEALPEKPFGCLVTVMDTEPMTMEEFENILPYFVGYDGEQWNDWEGHQCPLEVLAWMPIPEPYAERRQDG